MLQFHHVGAAPDLDLVARLFGIQVHELEAAFGVIATDPDAGLYTVLVDDAALPAVRRALRGRPAHPAEALFSNPRVEPT